MTGQQQIEQLFADFQALHPNNREAFDPTIDNLLRWEYSVRTARERGEIVTKPFERPNDNRSRQFANSRRVASFQQFPTLTQNKYFEIAALFPGRRVYATGSRVTGEFIELGANEKVKKMRADLLKKNVAVSDYDFTIDFEPGDDLEKMRSVVPPGFDLVQNVPPGEPKILIPMWDFTKIPPDRHGEIVEMVEQKQWGRLMDIHNEFGLSSQTLCCNDESAKRWFTWAIENGLIERQPGNPNLPKMKNPPPPPQKHIAG